MEMPIPSQAVIARKTRVVDRLRQVLPADAVISDEVLAATCVISTLLTVLIFVGTTLAVNSVLDGVDLIVTGSTWMRNVSSDAAGPGRLRAAGPRSCWFLSVWTRSIRSDGQNF